MQRGPILLSQSFPLTVVPGDTEVSAYPAEHGQDPSIKLLPGKEPIWTFFHVKSFLRNYGKFWEEPADDEPTFTWLGLLFSITCHTALFPHPELRGGAGTHRRPPPGIQYVPHLRGAVPLPDGLYQAGPVQGRDHDPLSQHRVSLRQRCHAGHLDAPLPRGPALRHAWAYTETPGTTRTCRRSRVRCGGGSGPSSLGLTSSCRSTSASAATPTPVSATRLRPGICWTTTLTRTRRAAAFLPRERADACALLHRQRQAPEHLPRHCLVDFLKHPDNLQRGPAAGQEAAGGVPSESRLSCATSLSASRSSIPSISSCSATGWSFCTEVTDGTAPQVHRHRKGSSCSACSPAHLPGRGDQDPAPSIRHLLRDTARRSLREGELVVHVQLQHARLFSLADMILCLELSCLYAQENNPMSSDHAIRAFGDGKVTSEAVVPKEQLLEILEISRAIWLPAKKESSEANRAFEILTKMLYMSTGATPEGHTTQRRPDGDTQPTDSALPSIWHGIR